MDYLIRARELSDETVSHRRYLHKNAEVGLDMPKACSYITNALAACKITPKRCAGGITATIGDGSPVILLRADMDALPMAENSGLDFACPTKTEAHTCGHDLHAAMLLTAAKMMKENENELKGTVKLMFQPGEEILQGAESMICDGILENPKPNAALSFHVGPTGKVGEFFYNNESTMMLSCSNFRIHIKGKGGHGGYPHKAINPLTAAAALIEALEKLSAEIDPTETTTVTIGSIQGGTAPNIIPETAEISGTIRTSDDSRDAYLCWRINEITEHICSAYRCKGNVEILTRNPALKCDKTFTDETVGFIREINGNKGIPGVRSTGSDDFAEITAKIPSAYIFLAAGFSGEKNADSHNSKVKFNEEVLPLGAALFAHCAHRWLENN